MRTIEVKLYQFEELSPEAKKVAIKAQQSFEYENGEPLAFFDEYCEEKAQAKGFKNITLQYSLSYSQGDGLSFAAKEIDIKKFIALALPNCKKSVATILEYYISYSAIGHNGRYCYASESDIDVDLNGPIKDYPNIQKLVNTIQSTVRDEYMELCSILEAEGYNWLENSQKDEVIIDTIEANEHEFTADGKRYY